MTLPEQLANQFRENYLEGNWIATNWKAELEDVDLAMATTQIGNCNTIALLAFHINYYVAGVTQVLEGGPLEIRDKYSFDMPLLESEAAWEARKVKMWEDGEKFAALVAALPEAQLQAGFVKPEYGTYFRNLAGMMEHSYYHLGQVVLLKKLIRSGI